MAKVNVNAVTRLQKYLKAIAGDAAAPKPITDFEKLLFNIAEAVAEASTSDIPDIQSEDYGKYLRSNSETGALEWSAVSGGSGASILPTEIENDLYTETLGEVVECQITILGQTQTFSGIEAVGMTSDIASEIRDNTTTGADPAPMKYTYRIGDVIYDNSSDAGHFIPTLADDGKYYFRAGDDTVFYGASGEVVAIYKTSLIFPPNVLCLYDPADPKGDESYLPEYAEYDDGVFVVSSDYDASAFYNALTNGYAVYAVFHNFDSNNGYEYMLTGSFYPFIDDDDENCLVVSLFGGDDVYIYNWTGANDNDDEENEVSDDSGEIIINPIGGGDHEMPAPDDEETM